MLHEKITNTKEGSNGRNENKRNKTNQRMAEVLPPVITVLINSTTIKRQIGKMDFL